jgi:hypothetical protein
LYASVVTKMARPGKSVSQGATSIIAFPSVRRPPQVARGGGTPRPRKERPLSRRIAPATAKVADTSTGASAFGRMCRKMMRPAPAPWARIACTNSRSRSARNSARTRRATPIQLVRPMMIMMLSRLCPMKAMTARIRKSDGNTSITSTSHITAASIFPPKYPAMAPSRIPMASEIPTATNPTEREICAPYIIRDSTSRPRSSVPNQWPGCGGTSCAVRSSALGS